MGKWIHSSVYFIWSFQLKNIINTVYFVISFKCDLNLALSINTGCKMGGGNEHPLVHVEEYLDWLGHFSHFLSCFN
jgi:hypothetical protein